MAYVTKTFDEIVKGNVDYSNYKLCYIDSISETEWSVHPDDRDRYEKCTYDDFKNNPRLYHDFRFGDWPNPEYNKETSTHYAFFTPKSLDEQWGDDWNDAPYEHNAGWPYDSDIVEVNENNVATRIEEYDILKVPFAIKSYNYALPCDNHLNSPWSVQDINSDAVAWIYDVVGVEDGVNGKGQKIYKRAYTTVHAGINPYDFNTKINRINELNKTAWESSRDDE